MQAQNVRIDLIELEAGTQQRKIDPNLTEQYEKLMADGVEFPPLEIVRDGDVYILYDGFHRLKAILNIGKAKSVRAFVEKGTQRDAIWRSYGANNKHGCPRPKGTIKKIVTAILSDPSWAKKSLKTIADHVGTTRDNVNHIQKAMREATKEYEQQKASSQAVKGEKVIDSPPPPVKRASTVEATSSRGKKYEQKSQAKEHKKPEIPTDSVGQEIPKHLVTLYESRSVVYDLLRHLQKLKTEVDKHVKTRDPTFSYLNETAFKANYENLRRTLKTVIFTAVCCNCNGDTKVKCKPCGQIGLLNADRYRAVIEELKPKGKKK
ncbi:hypothetical protein LCGC14_0895730 [marine sediment metagenome]|uniref:ParB/Sulfiredoxin domain-containing protein n=1 Tax=marine sediment metagenome TaxID=412755 RepID=A0A0F9RH44_9ZZZZ